MANRLVPDFGTPLVKTNAKIPLFTQNVYGEELFY